jgi:hypothetical protein
LKHHNPLHCSGFQGTPHVRHTPEPWQSGTAKSIYAAQLRKATVQYLPTVQYLNSHLANLIPKIEEIFMRFKLLLTALLLTFFAQTALAQLEPFKDYDTSSELWNITFIKVDPNLGDDYLEGLKET